MAKVSVIVPVYNLENYIAECIESILNQTFSDFELIIVDDGSTDASYDIIQKYAEQDARVIAIRQENQGVTYARNNGLRRATSEYVMFSDGDDYYAKNTIYNLYEKIRINDVEMVFNQCCYKVYGDKKVKYSSGIQTGIYTYENGGMQHLLNNIWDKENGKSNIMTFLWLNIYRKDVFEKIQLNIPQNISYYEDTTCMYAFLATVNRIYVMEEPFYFYRMREESSGFSLKERNLTDLNERYHYVKSFFEKNLCKDSLMEQLKYRTLSDMFACRLFLNKPAGFFLFPYEKVEKNSKIVLYGAGLVAKSYYKQLIANHYCEVVAVTDVRADEVRFSYCTVIKPEMLIDVDFDYILICMLRKDVAKSVKHELHEIYDWDLDKIIIHEPKSFMSFIDIEGE